MGQFQSLEDVLSVLRRRFMLILGFALIGAALSMLYALGLPRVYESKAIIQIELPNINDTSGSGPTSNPVAQAKYRLNLIEQQLMARDSLVGVIDELGLFSGSSATDSEKITALRKAVSIEQIVDQAEAWRPDAVPSGLSITVRLNDAQAAAHTANLFLSRILGQAEARRTSEANAAVSFFASEEARVSGKITALEADIAAYKGANADSLPANVTSLRGQLATLRETELDIERDIIGLKSNTGRLREDVLAKQIEDLEVQRKLVQDRIAGVEAAIQAAPEVEREMSRMNRELDQLNAQFTVITTRKAEAELGQAAELNRQSERFEVLEAAMVPDRPVAPSRKKILALGTILFVMMGVGLAMMLEMLNPAIRSARQLERELGVAPIVSIPDLDRSGARTTGHGRWRLILGAALAAAAVILALFWPILRRGAGTAWAGAKRVMLAGVVRLREGMQTRRMRRARV